MRMFVVGTTPVVFLLALAPEAVAESAYLLRATIRSQTVQNKRADAENLSRISDKAMLERFRKAGLLVRVPNSGRHHYTKYITADYSYLRPWSKLFLEDISRQYHARFKKRLRVTSMVRTASLQRSLAKRNGNAAAATGARRSSHLTGATLDISKNGMSAAEIAWMRKKLHALRLQKHIYAIEEFSQPTFHIMVHKDYATARAAKPRTTARARPGG
ncbi:MAG: hypothetical protein KIT09_14320 [Bryobacteraceae bacterium]|nr:hypothetical protein [Bryobacteraceae bacterium]